MPEDIVNKAQPEDNELWAIAVMERTVDAVRFRVDGLRPDLLQERPAGFERTMLDVISAWRRGEDAFAAAIRQAAKEDNPSLKTTFSAFPSSFVPEPFEEVGAFVVARERTLGTLRNLSAKGFERTINDPERGKQTVISLALEWARHDRRQLDVLKDMRMALVNSMRPGIRTMQGHEFPDPSR